MVDTNRRPQIKGTPIQDKANSLGQASPESKFPLFFVLGLGVMIVLNLVLFWLAVVGVITFPMPMILAAP